MTAGGVDPGSGAEGAPPRKVFLFSGHMIDAPGRQPARFPPAVVPAAARAIGADRKSIV